MTPPCDLCAEAGGALLWSNLACRVVLVADADYPGFCRVILNRHIREMTDLEPSERVRMMEVVFAVETALRGRLSPDKMNLASLGNQSPHVHWHVIPRYADDPHFPGPIWASRRREPTPRPQPATLADDLRRDLAESLGPSRVS